jgi:membrane-bound ClpP family serine protease
MYGGLNLWSNTPMGRRALGAPTEEEEQAQRLAEDREQDERMKLLNATGVALTELRPVGMVQIGEHRHSALAEAGFIRAGAPVRVTVVESHAIRVREESRSI